MKKKIKVPKTLIPELAKRWAAGERYPALAKAAGEAIGREVTIGTFRFWLIKHLGGPKGYAAAAAKREEAHPRPKLQPPGRQVVRLDDSKVPVIKSSKYRDGWQSRGIMVAGYRTQIFTSPKGLEYVMATETQRADLIMVHKTPGLGQTRLRLYEGTGTARAAKKEKKLVAKDEKVRAAKKKAKKIKRKGVGK